MKILYSVCCMNIQAHRLGSTSGSFLKTNTGGLILCLIFLSSLMPSISSKAQDFLPFNSEVSKRFVNFQDANDDQYFFHAASEHTIGSSIQWKQYNKQSGVTVDPEPSSMCYPWGGQWHLLDSLWTGRTIEYDTTTQILTLYNSLGVPLHFSFGLNPQDSSIFYSDNTNFWYLIYDGSAQENFLDTVDTVKTYHIRKYNVDNVSIPSALNDFEIKLSEQFGLIRFIDCFHFPASQVMLKLAGQTYPSLGYYQLTMDEIYPFHGGDTLQYHGYLSTPTGYSYTNQIITITDRIESIDSVWIYWENDLQFVNFPSDFGGGGAVMSYSNPITFRKRDPISRLPNGSSWGTTSFAYDDVDSCGLRKRFTSIEGSNIYCDSCDCYGYYDSYVPLDENTYLEGLGKSQHHRIDNSTGYSSNCTLTFNNIGGATCGNFVPLDISEKKFLSKYAVYPNPTKDILNIIIPEIRELKCDYILSNAQGQFALTGNINLTPQNNQINVSSLPAGIYALKVYTESGLLLSEKVLKE